MKKILIVYGTRPELIKMAPVVWALQKSKTITPVTCASGQHRELLKQAEEYFNIHPDHSFQTMKPDQDLFDVTSTVLNQIKLILRFANPDMVLVQGDTTTAFAAALASFYLKIPVGHIEAGLRTHDSLSPFPEEMNRVLIGRIAALHFAPTQKAVENLAKEGVSSSCIYQVGNTGIDSVLWAGEKASEPSWFKRFGNNQKVVILTAHRRENFGHPIRQIFGAVKKFASLHPDFQIVYPVHPNPNVFNVAHEFLGKTPNIHLISPLDFGELAYVLARCHFVVTDSGGLQEEAPSFGKPVLVLRESTERPEAVTAGCAKLVGSNEATVFQAMAELAKPGSLLYSRMARVENPFGDGTSAQQISCILERYFELTPDLETFSIENTLSENLAR